MLTLPTLDAVELEVSGAWLTAWFNRPEKRNTLTDHVIDDLFALLAVLPARTDIRGVTFRGRGGFFCSGGDLTEFQQLVAAPRADTIAASQRVGDLLTQVDTIPQVTIAAIEGAAMAGGLGLACACDVALATAATRFGFSETRIGITPAQIAPYVLRKCGYASGRRLMVTAARFEGYEAQRLGLIDHCVQDGTELSEAENTIRHDVLACAPAAVSACKTLLRHLPTLDPEGRVPYAAENFTDCLHSDAGQEGVAAFLEKRKPRWAEGGV